MSKSPKMANYIQEVYDASSYHTNVVARRQKAQEVVKSREPDSAMTDKMIDEHLEKNLIAAASPSPHKSAPKIDLRKTKIKLPPKQES